MPDKILANSPGDHKDVGLYFAIAYRLRMHALPIVLAIDIQVRKRLKVHGEAMTDCLLVRANGEKYQISLEQLAASSDDRVLGRRRALRRHRQDLRFSQHSVRPFRERDAERML
ncbi:hypothetical protein [Bradyrhizobium sp. LTSP849]|uniref:hypothetical protein n=1 Tax=Bradyrhizobium sp. LTSP849 TaxID=1615890 RepID=UPI0012E05C15|nr:hypothetical protein [Bradyrhizobium sp. LTSP849]